MSAVSLRRRRCYRCVIAGPRLKANLYHWPFCCLEENAQRGSFADTIVKVQCVCRGHYRCTLSPEARLTSGTSLRPPLSLK